MSSAEEFKEKLASYLGAFNSSSILSNDEDDAVAQTCCTLVPEGCVSLLIGKMGSNVNETKAACGVDISFCKKDESVHGLRKCFHSGSIAGITKAIYVLTSFLAETQNAASGIGIVVKNVAAGAVIGKQGCNLKGIREQTGCNISMEKSEESIPALGGRCLSVRHSEASPRQITLAAYLTIRTRGFGSPSSSESRAAANSFDLYDANASYGYGPAAVMAKNRFSPYGSPPDICAIHGKKRGKRNLRMSPTMPGSWVCLEEDPCKVSGNNPAPTMSMGGMGMGGLGGMGMGMGGMGMMSGMGGMGGMGGLGMGMYGMDSSPNGICALHGKKRGAANLQPHPSNPSLMICYDHDMCKGSISDSGGGMGSSICATHGKRRGVKNLQPHPTTPGLYVCLEEDMCKI